VKIQNGPKSGPDAQLADSSISGALAFQEKGPSTSTLLGTFYSTSALIASLLGVGQGTADATEDRQRTLKPFSLADLSQMPVITEPQISPDSKLIALCCFGNSA